MSTPEDRVTQVGTEYVVLVDTTPKDHDPTVSGLTTPWRVLMHEWGTSAESAIRKAAQNDPGTYVAIPASSWKPRKVSVETVSRVKLEDA